MNQLGCRGRAVSMGQGSAVPWKDIKVEVGVDRLSSSSCDFHLPSTIYHLPSSVCHLHQHRHHHVNRNVSEHRYLE